RASEYDRARQEVISAIQKSAGVAKVSAPLNNRSRYYRVYIQSPYRAADGQDQRRTISQSPDAQVTAGFATRVQNAFAVLLVAPVRPAISLPRRSAHPRSLCRPRPCLLDLTGRAFHSAPRPAPCVPPDF